MFFNFRRLKTGAVVVLAMLSMPVAGQDLLARQAPIDKKMRAVDSVFIPIGTTNMPIVMM